MTKRTKTNTPSTQAITAEEVMSVTTSDMKNAILLVSLAINALFLIGYVTLKVAALYGYSITIPL
jgi:hypothetical protein